MVNSNPPGGKFGPSPQTQILRPDVKLSDIEISVARKRRKQGASIEDIAEELGFAIEEIELALASMRTPTDNPTRRTINVGINAYNAIISEKGNGEPLWQTMDKLLTELERLRKFQSQVRNSDGS